MDEQATFAGCEQVSKGVPHSKVVPAQVSTPASNVADQPCLPASQAGGPGTTTRLAVC